jgi:hypothetical protein
MFVYGCSMVPCSLIEKTTAFLFEGLNEKPPVKAGVIPGMAEAGRKFYDLPGFG